MANSTIVHRGVDRDVPADLTGRVVLGLDLDLDLDLLEQVFPGSVAKRVSAR